MSKATAGWLLLLIAAGGWLLFSLFSAPADTLPPTPVALVEEEVPTTIAVVDESVSAEINTCTTSVPITGGTLVEGIVGAPVSINPLSDSNNPVDRQLVDLIFDGLVRFDGRGIPQPALAESWVISDDALTFTFTLDGNAQWHDQQPVRAQDVAYTYGLLQSAESTHPDSPLWQTVTISVIDDRTIEFKISEPYTAFMVALSRGILPSHLLNGIGLTALATHQYSSRPIGTGPFIVVNNYWEEGTLRLLPNQRYFGQQVGLDWLEIRFFATESARADAYALGEIDSLIDVGQEAIPQALALEGARLFSSTQLRYSQLMLNTDSSTILSNKSVREALSIATDRQRLVDEAVFGQGVPFNGPFAPTSWAASSGFAVQPPSIISATLLIEEAGWRLPADSDVWIQLQDDITETLSVQLLTDDSAEHARIAQSIINQWQDIQVFVEWTPLAWDAYKDTLNERNFDAALVRIEPLADPDLYDFWSQEAIISGQNFAGWNNRRASEALEAGRQLVSLEERAPFYAAFNREFAAQTPAISLFQYAQTYLLADHIISVTDERPVFLPTVVHPRDRFTTLPEWRINTTDVEVACE